MSDKIFTIVDNAKNAVENLRSNDELYEKVEGAILPAAPLADAPMPPTGKLSVCAERAISKTGLWGLFVPQVYGGSGCSHIELMQAIIHLACVNPTVSGLLSVHSTIGAVSALTTFGSNDQRQHWLPRLAEGKPMSVFAATEPDAGCDLHRVASQLDYDGKQFRLTGTKMFITGATYGRLVKLLAISEGKPVIVLVKLPDSDTPHFTLQSYGLHPLKHAHNNALKFERFPVDSSCVLRPEKTFDGQESDGMSIVWHGLNRGRVALAAQAAGTISLLLNQAAVFSGKRHTWGQPIQKRELVLGRLGRMASAKLVCEALSGWSASVIDGGGSGELEAILAKVVASRCLRQVAVDALGIHGGRAFLVGHPLGDSFHDHFAAGIYEGESDLLGLALFKGVAKHHPLASKKTPLEWMRWRCSQSLKYFSSKEDATLLDGELRDLAIQARRGLVATSVEADRLLRRHGKKLVEQQLILANLSDQIQGLISCLAVIHLADRRADNASRHAAICWCRPVIMKFLGKPLGSCDYKRLAELGRCSLGSHSD
jgi:alkylation response protein AidB-like acyl-CoA dehydrogenase